MILMINQMRILTKKELQEAQMFQCLNEKCGRQIVSLNTLMFCPVCEAGALEVIQNDLPF